VLLALETSTKHLSVALLKEGALVEEINIVPDGISHSEKLLPVIDQLLSKHSSHLSSLQQIAVSAGPGSFTSLRVGMATALGLANGVIPIVGISSLRALCMKVEADSYLAPVLLAGRGRVYGAVFEKSGASLKVIVAEGSYILQEFTSQIQTVDHEVSIFGHLY
jgi:tRNA threonylcarbamoyladenosine biosynthesis protein TsaB